MAAAHPPCHDKHLVGHLVWHEVRFLGPDVGHPCDLPEHRQGHVEHVFVNGSIYPQTFTTTALARPAALSVAGPAGPPAVRVSASVRGPLRADASTGIASQVLAHLPGTGISPPHMATADFSTAAIPPWGPRHP